MHVLTIFPGLQMSNTKAAFAKLLNTGFFSVFGGEVINKIIAFMSSLVLVRLLTKAEYGNFSYAWNIYNFIILLNGLGIVSGSLQLCSEYSHDAIIQTKVCRYGTKIALIWNVVLSITLLVIGLFVPLAIPNAKYLLVLLCLLPSVQFLYQQSTALLRAQKRNNEFARTNVLNTAILFALSVVGSLIFREKGLVFAYYSAYLISLFVLDRFSKLRVWGAVKEFPRKLSRDLMKISVISMCNNGLSQLLYLVDVFVIGLVMADELAVAGYKVATLIPTALSFIPIAVILYVYPYFAEHREDRSWCRKQYGKLLGIMAVANFFISAVLFLCAPLIITFFFGAQYMDALLPFRILSVSYFFSGTFRVISGNLLVTQRKLRFNLLVAVVSGIVNVILDWVLIQRYGAVGAAMATISIVILSSIMSTSYLVHVFSVGKTTKSEGNK